MLFSIIIYFCTQIKPELKSSCLKTLCGSKKMKLGSMFKLISVSETMYQVLLPIENLYHGK